MIYLYAGLLVLLNTLWLPLSLLGLPGNWLMIGTALLLRWWVGGELPMFSTTMLIAVAAMAGLGELLELLAGAGGSRKAGGTRWGAVGALSGGILGGIIGTFAMPVPIVGTLGGAAVGAFAGAVMLELLAGMPHAKALRSGRGAAVGHLLGVICKFALGCIIWLTLAIAAFV